MKSVMQLEDRLNELKKAVNDAMHIVANDQYYAYGSTMTSLVLEPMMSHYLLSMYAPDDGRFENPLNDNMQCDKSQHTNLIRLATMIALILPFASSCIVKKLSSLIGQYQRSSDNTPGQQQNPDDGIEDQIRNLEMTLFELHKEQDLVAEPVPNISTWAMLGEALLTSSSRMPGICYLLRWGNRLLSDSLYFDTSQQKIFEHMNPDDKNNIKRLRKRCGSGSCG